MQSTYIGGFFVSFIVLLFAFSIAIPALAEYLGPDRTTSQFVTVRDPDKDVWTLTNTNAPPPYSPVCLIVHTCDQHPGVSFYSRPEVCGWVAENSSCSMAYKTEEQIVTLAEATISDNLQNCNSNNGWCTTSPTLHLTANEPLPGESITLIEGTRNGEAFACTSDTCDVPLVEGSNTFSFWALSSYGDGSQMGNASVQVDTVPPSSAFGSPPEGSSVWVSGVLNMSGSSSDASSGVASAEISLGGGGWQGLSLAGGSWAYSWDTSGLPDGSYSVLVRARDVAGHLESTAGITVHVDHTPPLVGLPDEWFIWEPIAISATDGGGGVDAAELTIHGGSLGTRKYRWSGGRLPGGFVWDRFFGSIVAPIGHYKVTLEVWDALGNSSSDSGKIVIPAPATPAPEPTSIPATDPPAAFTPLPTTESEAGGFIIVSTATSEPATASSSSGSGGGPAAAPLDESSSPTSFSGPDAPSPSSEAPSGLLWGSAALAAAAAATAYALSRRRAREIEIERMRHEIAAESSPAAFESRLARLRRAATAAIAPARNAYLAGLAAVAAAAAAAVDMVKRSGEIEQSPLVPGIPETGMIDESADRLHIPIPPGSVEDIDGFTEPSLSPFALKELSRLLPSVSFTPHSSEQPIINIGIAELGAFEYYTANGELNPLVQITPEKFGAEIGNFKFSIGWEGNRIGLSLDSPAINHVIDSQTSASVGSSASVGFAWNGWNSTFDYRYSNLDVDVSTEATIGYSGSGSDGIYWKGKAVQGVAIAVVAVAGVYAILTARPDILHAVGQWGRQLALPGLSP